MLKKFLISFVLFGFCFIDTKNGFAITAEDSLNKNNTQNTKQTEPYFDLPKKDAKEQCQIVSDFYKQKKKKSNKKFNINNLYEPIDLFELSYLNNNLELNEIIIYDLDNKPFSCLFYYKSKKIIGADCESSGYDEEPAELEDLITAYHAIRYKNDCIGKLHNEGSVIKKIKTNCFIKLNLNENQPQKNDIIIKNCSAKFHQ